MVAPIRVQQMFGEEPFAGPHLHDRELARRNNFLGGLRDLPADQLGEDGMHVKARVVVPLASDARSGRHVVAEFRVVERRLHKGSEGEGALPLEAGDQFLDQTGMTEFHRRSAADVWQNFLKERRVTIAYVLRVSQAETRCRNKGLERLQVPERPGFCLPGRRYSATWILLGPAAFARYIASSALRKSSSLLCAWSGKPAIPMLALRRASIPSWLRKVWEVMASWSRSATARAVDTVVSGRITTNSSPP